MTTRCKGKNANGEPCRRCVKNGHLCWQHCHKKKVVKKAQKSPPISKSYNILDNGGHPFQVVITPSTVLIYKQDNNIREKDPTLTFHPQRVFIGKSPKTRMTEFSGAYGPEWDGNSILLLLKDKTYVYIGAEIYEFKAMSPITKFVSPVGNSAVPYPYAVDEQDNYYLMIEDVIMLNRQRMTDPYDVYYDYEEKEGKSDLKGHRIVAQYTNQRWGLDYTVDAGKTYDLLTENGKMKMYFVDDEGVKLLVNKSQYVQFFKDWAKKLNYKNLVKRVLVQRVF